jgi:uncharacterized protein YnzC (UPF0291/DUF896 family)
LSLIAKRPVVGYNNTRRASQPASRVTVMATATTVSQTSDTAILSRLIRPEDDTLSRSAAEGWLAIRFEKDDLDRMHELAVKNQDGKLSAKEKTAMENYRRVSFLLDLMHSKARRSLKKRKTVH